MTAETLSEIINYTNNIFSHETSIIYYENTNFAGVKILIYKLLLDVNLPLNLLLHSQFRYHC